MEPIRPVDPPEGKKPTPHPKRICAVEDCDRRLASYNPGPNCYRHTPIKYPRVRGKPGALR